MLGSPKKKVTKMLNNARHREAFFINSKLF